MGVTTDNLANHLNNNLARSNEVYDRVWKDLENKYNVNRSDKRTSQL